jgi:hypothetical protein
MRTLTLYHAAANALLLALGYYWLGVGETRALTLTWSFAVLAVWVALACWSYGAPLVYFGVKDADARQAWRQALRNLVPLATAALLAVAIYAALSRWAEYSGKPSLSVASWLTLKLRKPVKPATMQTVFDAGLWLVRWVLLPILLMPVFAGVARAGWGGWRRPDVRCRRWPYWIAVPLLALGAFLAPLKLVGWTPFSGNFWLESLSLLVRAAVAYCILVAGWLGLAFATSGGNPRFTHPKTVVSP